MSEDIQAKLAACEAARDEYWRHSVELLRQNEELKRDRDALKARVTELEAHAAKLIDRIDGHERRTKADVLLIDRYVKETARLRAVVAGLDSPALLERLADIEHERWSRWMRYLCSKSAIEETFDGPPGTSRIVVPSESAMRWIRQMHTPYDQLTETEKESDRQEVRTTLAAIREHLALDSAPVPAGERSPHAPPPWIPTPTAKMELAARGWISPEVVAQVREALVAGKTFYWTNGAIGAIDNALALLPGADGEGK